MTLSGGIITVTDTTNNGNAVMVRNSGRLTLNNLPQDTAQAISGHVYLDSTGSLNANCGAGMYDSARRQSWYSSNAQALTKYETLLKLYTNEALELTRDARVDLNGHKVTVTGDFTLTGIDSTATTTHPGSGEAQFAGKVNPSLTYGGNRYIAWNEDGTVTFHMLTLRINKVSLRPGVAGIYYSTQILCDEVLEKAITKYGVAMSLTTMPGSDFADPATNSLYTQCVANGDFESGEFTGAILNQVMN